MKGMKKVLAFMLAVCLLIGMPMAVNVSAADNSLAFVQALVLPQEIADATGYDPERTILLSFSKDVSIDLDKTDVAVGFVNSTTGHAAGAKYFGNTTANQNSIQATTHTELVQSDSFGSKNNYIVTLAEDYPLSDIVKEFGARTAPWQIVVRLFDKTDAADAKKIGKNGVLDGVTFGEAVMPAKSGTSLYCNSGGNINGSSDNWASNANNACDYYQIPLTYQADTLTIKAAEWTAEDKVDVIFSQPIVKKSDNFFAGMRLVNAKNEVMQYRPDAEVKYATDSADGAERIEASLSLTDNNAKTTATVVEKSTVAIAGHDAGSVKTYSWFKAHLDACKAEHPDESFRIAFAVEESAQDNWYITGIAGAESGKPLMAVYGKAAGVNDMVMAKVTSFADPVVVEKVEIIDNQTVQATFSHAVKVPPTTADAYIGLRVIRANGGHNTSVSATVGGTTYGSGQIGLHTRASQSGEEYDTVWTFKANGVQNILAFAKAVYFDQDASKTDDLCFVIQANTGSHDSLIDAVVTRDGRKLTATHTNSDRFQQSIKEDDFLYLAPSAVLADDTTFLITTGPLSGTGWMGKVYLRAYDSEGKLLTLTDNAPAQWKLTVTKMEGTGQTAAHMTGAITANFGVSKYSEIVAVLDKAYPNGYDLVLTVDGDTRVNGSCSNMESFSSGTDYNNGIRKYLKGNALYSTAANDVGVIPYTMENILSISEVSLMDNAQGKGKTVIITFSHDIDIDHFLANMTDGNSAKSVMITTSKVGLNGSIVGPTEPNYDQANVDGLARYGNSKNKMIGTISAGQWNTFEANMAKLKETYEDCIPRLRIEMATGYTANTGQFPLNYNIKPLDANVLSPFINQMSNRIWADVEGYGPQLTMKAEQKSDHTILVTFSEPVTLNDSICKPYIGLRMVNNNNELIRAKKDNAGVTVASLTSGTYMQWSAKSYEMVNDTQMLITFADNANISEIASKSNMPAGLADYAIKLCIEESLTKNGVTDPNCVIGNGKVWTVVSKADPSRELAANVNVTATKWDGRYVEFTPLDPNAPLEVKDWSASIIGENEMIFEWTEAVNLGSGYRGVRFVTSGGALLYYNEATGEVTLAASRTENGKTVSNTALQWSVAMEYADSTKTKINARLGGQGRLGVLNLADLIEPAADSQWGKIKADAENRYSGSTYKLCMEEGKNTLPGVIDTFSGVDGKTILATPMMGDSNDCVQLSIKGKVIRGELKVTSAKVISDTTIELTFSSPIEILSDPYTAIRIYADGAGLLYYNELTQEYTTDTKQSNADGKPMYKDAKGNATTEAVAADGTKNTRIDNMPMQWGGRVSTISKDKTVIRYAIDGRKNAPINGVGNILSYDWAAIGAKAYFGIEEKGTHMRTWDQHINNIVCANDPRIALDGNFFPSDRDGLRLELAVEYTPVELTAKVEVISDIQLRVKFSHPVEIGSVFMAIRLLNKDGALMYNDARNCAYQWAGRWKYENEKKDSILWSLNLDYSMWGATNLYDLLTWAGPLEQFKDEGSLYFVMEESDSTTVKVGRNNYLIETLSTADGQNHLKATHTTGYDAFRVPIDGQKFGNKALNLESVTAIDEKTIKVKFNRDVVFKEGDQAVSMAIRYLSDSGDSDVLPDGKTAIFKGDWKYDGDDKSTVIWTLNSKHTDSLTDILTYRGKFVWNNKSRCAFVIMDQNKKYFCPLKSMRINGVTDADGVHHLMANYITKDAVMLQKDITVGYELPAVVVEPEVQIEYYSNYVPYIVAASVVALAAVAVAVILLITKKKNH